MKAITNFLLVGSLSSALLVGCSSSGGNNLAIQASSEILESSLENQTQDESPEGYLKIGGTAPIQYVQYVTRGVYQVGFVMDNGELEWIEFEKGVNLLKVVVSKDVKEPILERVEDKKEQGTFGYTISDQYVIRLPKDYPIVPIVGGVIKMNEHSTSIPYYLY
jgi:hypothetical protein